MSLAYMSRLKPTNINTLLAEHIMHRCFTFANRKTFKYHSPSVYVPAKQREGGSAFLSSRIIITTVSYNLNSILAS